MTLVTHGRAVRDTRSSFQGKSRRRRCKLQEFKTLQSGRVQRHITSSLIITRLRMTSTTSMALSAVWIVWMVDVGSTLLERLLGSWTQPQGGPGCQLLRCFVQTQVFMRCSCGLCKLMIDRWCPWCCSEKPEAPRQSSDGHEGRERDYLQSAYNVRWYGFASSANIRGR